jgi:tetratricopeptide (TPR) repeat protein
MPHVSRLLLLLATVVSALGMPAPGPLAQGAPSANTAPADPVREAEEALLASVDRAESGGDDAMLANAVRNLAMLYQTLARYSEARPLQERALALRESALGRDHADVLQSLADLALIDIAEGKVATAEQRYERILATQRRLYGRAAPQTAITVNSLARLHASRGDLRRAVGLYRDELAILETVNGTDSIRLVSTLTTLADLERRREHVPAAEKHYVRAMQIAEADGAPASQRRLAEILEAYAALLSPLPGRATESVRLAQQAADLRALNPGVDRRAGSD